MAANWQHGHHPPQGQGYGHNGYQQVYTQHQTQIHAQQNPYVYQQQNQQQYPSAQVSSHQVSQQAPVNPGYFHPSAPQQTQQSCYNCGAPDHWAQNCPEPRREVPAGSLNRQSHSYPFKRQKPNPPVVTKYAVPSYVQPAQGAPQAQSRAIHGHTIYPQYAGPQGPPTPLSAQSPSHPRWQQQPYYPQYQQSYVQTRSSDQQQQYHVTPQFIPTAPPTPATPYGPPTNQNLDVATQHSVNSYQQQYHHSAQHSPPSHAASGAYHGSSAPHFTGHQVYQTQPNAPVESVKLRKSSTNSSVSMHSMSVTPKLQQIESTDGESEEDELEKLDVPDIPSSTGGNFATLIERPLPANFVVADALEPFPPPAPARNGLCQSKHFNQDDSGTQLENIKSKNEWEDLKKDPIFLSLSDEGHVIPIKDIILRYKPQPSEDDDQYSAAEDGEVSPRAHSPKVQEHGQDIMDQLDHSLNNDSWKNGQAENSFEESTDQPVRASRFDIRKSWGNPRDASHTSTSASRTIRSVRPPSRPFPPPPPRQRSPSSSPERTPPRRGRTPSMFELNELWGQASPPPSNCMDAGKDEETSFPKMQNSDSTERPADETNKDRSKSQSHSEPSRRLSMYDGVGESPLTAGSVAGNSDGFGFFNRTNSHGKRSIDGQSMSPTHPRQEKSSGRKRDYNQQHSSDEAEIPKRRQVDDVTPKLKKRQPKVAAAYSRRW